MVANSLELFERVFALLSRELSPANSRKSKTLSSFALDKSIDMFQLSASTCVFRPGEQKKKSTSLWLDTPHSTLTLQFSSQCSAKIRFNPDWVSYCFRVPSHVIWLRSWWNIISGMCVRVCVYVRRYVCMLACVRACFTVGNSFLFWCNVLEAPLFLWEEGVVRGHSRESGSSP